MLSIRPKAVSEVKGREKASDSINAYVFYFSNDYFFSWTQFYGVLYRTFLDVAFVILLNKQSAGRDLNPHIFGI